jgi:hypothetical protein
MKAWDFSWSTEQLLAFQERFLFMELIISFNVIGGTVECDDVLLLRCGIVQGPPSTATILDLLYIPVWVLTIPDSSARALWQ